MLTSSVTMATLPIALMLFADNDEDALRHAEQLVDGHAIELWQGARRIATLRPRSNEGAHQATSQISTSETLGLGDSCRQASDQSVA